MEQSNKRDRILHENMYKLIVSLSLPIMLNSLIQTLYNVVDGIYISKLGSVQFAATSFIFPVNFLFISIGLGLAVAGTSIISRFIGAKEYEKANSYAVQLIVLSISLSIVLMVIAYMIAPILVRIMGSGNEQLAYYATSYLRVTILGMPFMFLYSIFTGILRAEGNNVLPTTLGMASAILNMILDPIFIFTFDLGVVGAALATLLAQFILAIVALYIFTTGNFLIKISFKNFKFNKDIIVESFKVALPSMIGQSGTAFGFMVLNTFVASYGTSILAAFAMVNRITSLIIQPAMGIGAALVAIVGQNLGANNIERAKEAFNKSIILASAIGIFGFVVLLTFDEAIINFFMQSKDDPSVITHGLTFLLYISFSMPLMGIFNVLKGLYQGSGYTTYSMFLEIGRLWGIRIPMILLFKNFTEIGAVGIWFSMSFSNLVIDAIGYIIYRTNKWTVPKLKNNTQKELA